MELNLPVSIRDAMLEAGFSPLERISTEEYKWHGYSQRRYTEAEKEAISEHLRYDDNR